MGTRNEFIPFAVSHPGRLLGRELEERGIKQKDFAKQIGMQATHLNSLIKGKMDISDKIAVKLEAALGISALEWLNMQNKYAYYSAKIEERGKEEAEALLKENAIGVTLNLKAFYSAFGIISSSASLRIKELFAIGNPDEISGLEVNCGGYFKKSEKCQIDDKNMRTWLFIAQCKAVQAAVPFEYVDGNAEKAAERISIMANANTLTVSDIRTILEENGIAYLHVPKLEKTPIDAYSTRVDGKYVIVATYRHNDMDKLAFDVLHELGHISLHLKKDGQSYISTEVGEKDAKEREADEFARDFLISPDVWKKIESASARSLNPYVVVSIIAKKAVEYNISPSIAVSRYKHDTDDFDHKRFRSPKIRESC